MTKVRLFPLTAMLLSTTLLATADANALKIFGITIFEDKQAADEDVIDPRRYDVELSASGGEGIEEAVQGASELWRNRESAVGGSAGLLARARGDYRRILAALYNEGHYGGSISITVNGRQAADIEAGTELPERSSVAIAVDPGPRFLFAETAIENIAPPAATRDDEVEQPSETGFSAGLPARAGVVKQAGERARDAWREQGYPKAAIAGREVVADHPSNTLDVRMRIDPGPRAAYGAVSVEGNQRMIAEFIARQTGLELGKEYDPDDIERAKKRLARLDVFSVYKVEEGAEVGPDGTLPFNVFVQEKPLRRIGVGATYSTVDGFGLETYWLHRNLFGRAESLRLTGKVAGVGETFQYDEFDYSVGALFRKPGFIHPDNDLTIDIVTKREFNDAFTEVSAGGDVGFERFVTDSLTVRGGFRANYGQFDDVFGERTFLTTGLVGGLRYDTRDSKTEPTEGVYADIEAFPYYEWEYGNFAARFEAEARAYAALDSEGRIVLAGRLKVGSIVGTDIEETPPNLLFLAGGGGSVRGYAYNNIGIRYPDGSITGGLSLVEGSAEIRARFTKTIGAVAFVDFGTVGRESYPDFGEDLKIGAGAGLRYYTGLGAIRLDVAVPLDRGPGDPSFGLYAGIGQAF